MNRMFFLLFTLYASILSAQGSLFVWAESGLSLRAEPSLDAEVITIIPYGYQVASSGQVSEVIEVTALPAVRHKIGDGRENYLESQPYKLYGRFEYVGFGDAAGYAYSAYLLPFPPPEGHRAYLNLREWLTEDESKPLELMEFEKYGDLFVVETFAKGRVLTAIGNDYRQKYSLAIPGLSLGQAYVIANRLFRLHQNITFDPDEREDTFIWTLKTDQRTYLNFQSYNSSVQVELAGGFAVITESSEW